jgi:hypothetical protein
MSTERPDPHATPAETVVLLHERDGSTDAVPLAVLEQHRVPPQGQAQVAAALREQAPEADLSEATPLYELTTEDLAPFRLAEAGTAPDVTGFGGLRLPRSVNLLTWPIYEHTFPDGSTARGTSPNLGSFSASPGK